MNKIKVSILGLYFFIPTQILAALGDNGLTENTRDASLGDFLVSIQNWLLGFVGALAVLFIVYGGFLYMTSGGNQQKVDTAKKTLTYAIGGLIIVILAGLIFNIITGDFLTSIFGNKTLSY
ncbi:MAG: pilin [Patescibacteria group bacterium]|nr:pilin [Patescibacteria group bacterium]